MQELVASSADLQTARSILPFNVDEVRLVVDLLSQVWLATLLFLVIVTLTFALLTRPGWSKEPKFGFIDSKQ